MGFVWQFFDRVVVVVADRPTEQTDPHTPTQTTSTHTPHAQQTVSLLDNGRTAGTWTVFCLSLSWAPVAVRQAIL